MMLQLIRKRAGLVLAGLVAALCPMLMAPTGGVSQVQSAFEIIGSRACTGGDTAGLCVTHTQSSHNKWAVALRPQGGAGNILGELITCVGNATDTCLRVDTAAGTTFSIKGDGSTTGLPQSVDSGSLTINFQTGADTTCTVNGTNGAVVLHKVGSTVVARVTTAGSCTVPSGTSMVTGQTSPPIPAAFRPANLAFGTTLLASGASNALGMISINPSGTLVLSLPAGAGAVTTMGILQGQSWTYTVD